MHNIPRWPRPIARANIFLQFALFSTILFFLPPTMAKSANLEFDIIICGGSFSAPAAALQAARINPTARILLTEPTDWIGGQSTSQGVSAIDNAWHNPGRTLMLNDPDLYYAADYLDWLDRMRNPGAAAPGRGLSPNGTCWVSRESFDPRTGVWALEQMLAEFPNITYMPMTVVKNVTTQAVSDARGDGRVITGLSLIQRTPANGYIPGTKLLSEEIGDWYSTVDSADFTKQVHSVSARDAQKGIVVVDVSELGDAIVLSGSVYTVGRETTTEKMNEDGSIPAFDEDGTQAIVFPFCMGSAPAPDDEADVKALWPDFDSYLANQTASFYSLGSFSWQRVWSYRRLYTTGALYQSDSVFQGDVSMQNWNPGNDYPYGSFLKSRAAASTETTDWMGGVALDHIAGAEIHAAGWYFWMKERRPTAWDMRLLRGNDADNMMGTGSGLSRFPYIRGTRRIIGLDNFRLTERYMVDTAGDYVSGASYRFYDSVGIGNYAADIHATYSSSGLAPTKHLPAPFYVPYRAIGSTNVRNLLAGGKMLATTYVTNSAYRLHPIEWSIGSACGGAAGLMARDGVTNYDLLELTRLRELQASVAENSPIHWSAYDASPIPPYNGDLVLNDFKRIDANTAFPVEAYHHKAVRAEILINGNLHGETTYRANGRLLYEVPGLVGGTHTLTALLYDESDTVIDTLEVTFTIESVIIDFEVVDNNDPGCTFTGAWTLGSGQPDKYGDNYHYKFGNSGAGKATWSLDIQVSGTYEIAIWYPISSNRATDSPYTVVYRDGQTTYRVNQQQNGGRWVVLGEFAFEAGGNARVELTTDISDTSKLVVADAVRYRRIVPPSPSVWIVSQAKAGKQDGNSG